MSASNADGIERRIVVCISGMKGEKLDGRYSTTIGRPLRKLAFFWGFAGLLLGQYGTVVSTTVQRSPESMRGKRGP